MYLIFEFLVAVYLEILCYCQDFCEHPPPFSYIAPKCGYNPPFKKQGWLGVVMPAFNPSTQGGRRLIEFVASLVYTVNSRPA